MSDLFELQLTLDLPGSLPASDLALIRQHLGEVEDEGQGSEASDPLAEHPLLSSRGPAHRIGGTLVGELLPGPVGWGLTVRQEVHPDEFEALRTLLIWLAARTTSVGAIGYLRFLEHDVPDVLIAAPDSPDGIHRLTLRPGSPAQRLLPDG
ncbi:hypothetical protein [Streptomyces sp. NPDC021212]|uniref:hypothetical protein n=1 Tax=Streptomyces sp. NPDC021212 TaxID=3365118 RepID=UPI0037935D68